ncbi:hypothetical protein AB0J52_15840 [Spirillospora sp. NPDC049652]
MTSSAPSRRDSIRKSWPSQWNDPDHAQLFFGRAFFPAPVDVPAGLFGTGSPRAVPVGGAGPGSRVESGRESSARGGVFDAPGGDAEADDAARGALVTEVAGAVRAEGAPHAAAVNSTPKRTTVIMPSL